MSIFPAQSQKSADRHAQLVTQAEKWVAQTFYGTLLKQMRESPFKSKLFDGGEGGDAFNSLYDQKLADRMSKGAGGKLVKAIVRKIEGAAAYRKDALAKAAAKEAGVGREWSAQ
jgi:Rod binding domain-containing protein